MRSEEFKLRQREISNPNLTEEQKVSIRKLLKENVSKRFINMMFGTSYKQLKNI
jgi:hypothetical protein